MTATKAEIRARVARMAGLPSRTPLPREWPMRDKPSHQVALRLAAVSGALRRVPGLGGWVGLEIEPAAVSTAPKARSQTVFACAARGWLTLEGRPNPFRAVLTRAGSDLLRALAQAAHRAPSETQS